MGIKEWWTGLDYNAQDWFVVSGLVMLCVAGIAAGVVGLNCLPLLEPMVHLGFATAIASLLGGMFTFMSRVM